MYSLSSSDGYYPIHFIRDRKFLKDFTVGNEYDKGRNGGFFMFKFPRPATLYDFSDKVYAIGCDEMSLDNPAYIFVDDRGITSPVSNIKDDTKISQPGVNKVLACRVEFRKLRSAVGLFDADGRDALQNVFDEVCGPNHGNRFLLDEDSKIEMATRALEEEKGRQLTNAEKANVIIRIEDYFGRRMTANEKRGITTIITRKLERLVDRMLTDDEKAEIASIVAHREAIEDND